MSNTYQEILYQRSSRDSCESMVRVGNQWVSLQVSREMKRRRKSILDWLIFGGLLGLLSVSIIGLLWAYAWGCQRVIAGVM
jgi:hypothetical protein